MILWCCKSIMAELEPKLSFCRPKLSLYYFCMLQMETPITFSGGFAHSFLGDHPRAWEGWQCDTVTCGMKVDRHSQDIPVLYSQMNIGSFWYKAGGQ